MTRFVNRFWSLGLGIAFLGAAFLTTALLVKNHLDQETGGEAFLPITEDLRFSFTPLHDNINILVLRLRNPGQLNKDPYEVQILQGDTVLVSQQFSGINVRDSDLRIQFPPLPNTQGDNLDILLRPLSKADHPIQVARNQQGRLSFQAFYRSNQITESFFTKLGDLRFLLLWGVTIVVLLIYV